MSQMSSSGFLADFPVDFLLLAVAFTSNASKSSSAIVFGATFMGRDLLAALLVVAGAASDPKLLLCDSKPFHPSSLLAEF